MNEQDREAIDRLFGRLADAERQAGPKDAEADAYIRQKIGAQPGAVYMMAQTVVMQTYALDEAQARIEALEQQLAERLSQGGGFLSGMFGGSRTPDRPQYRGSVPAAGQPVGAPAGMPFPTPQPQPAPGSGGFLAGAAQTAMAVAGGMLLGNAIGGMFGGSTAHAAPAAGANPAAPETPAAPAEPTPEPAAAEGGGFLESIFGDFGGGDTDA